MSDPRNWPVEGRDTLARVLRAAKRAHTCTNCGHVGDVAVTPVEVDGVVRLVPICREGCR